MPDARVPKMKSRIPLIGLALGLVVGFVPMARADDPPLTRWDYADMFDIVRDTMRRKPARDLLNDLFEEQHDRGEVEENHRSAGAPERHRSRRRSSGRSDEGRPELERRESPLQGPPETAEPRRTREVSAVENLTARRFLSVSPHRPYSGEEPTRLRFARSSRSPASSIAPADTATRRTNRLVKRLSIP